MRPRPHAVEVPFHSPPANHIACAFDFSTGADDDYEERTLTTKGWFAEKDDPACVEEFSLPDPQEHMSSGECRAALEAAQQDFAVMGIMWSAHYQDACAAFGMEEALMTMLTEPEMFQAVIDRILEFHLEANEIFYEAGRGLLDAVHPRRWPPGWGHRACMMGLANRRRSAAGSMPRICW